MSNPFSAARTVTPFKFGTLSELNLSEGGSPYNPLVDPELSIKASYAGRAEKYLNAFDRTLNAKIDPVGEAKKIRDYMEKISGGEAFNSILEPLRKLIEDAFEEDPASVRNARFHTIAEPLVSRLIKDIIDHRTMLGQEIANSWGVPKY